MFRKILDYAGPYKKGLYFAFLLLLVSVVLGIVPFIFTYQVIVRFLTNQTVSSGYVLVRVFLILVSLIGQAVIYGLGLKLSHKSAYQILLRLRLSLQKQFEKLPLGVIQEKGTGTIKKLFVDDIDSLELLLAHSLPEGLANLLVPLATYGVMFLIDWRLACLSLTVIPFSLLAMKMMYSVGMKKMGAYYEAGQRMNNTIIEFINGMEVIKIFNRAGDSFKKFKTDVNNYRDYTLNWYKASWPWMAIYHSLLLCPILLTLPVGAWFVLQGWATLADFVLILCLSFAIGTPLLKALGFLPTIPQLNFKITALENVLSAELLKQSPADFAGIDTTIAFEAVSFAYEAENILQNVTFEALAGQKTAIVGESGSGKSTLGKLLVHYYDPQTGVIKIGGQALTEMRLDALNQQISYVAQDQFLFDTSILENIRMGRLSATDQEVRVAAEKAQCLEFIDKLPKGLNTQVAGAGRSLSGGQRQRISLARAILKNAPIVILDEATAYADPENAEKMERAISELVQGKTLLVIAHKLPAIMNADRICVMAKGKLVGVGTHQELMASCPEYQRLWRATKQGFEWKVAVSGEVSESV